MPVAFENLRTFLCLVPAGWLTQNVEGSESIFFTDKGRQWVMIFTGTEVDGVWDMTPDDWSEAAQNQNEARSVGACFGWR